MAAANQKQTNGNGGNEIEQQKPDVSMTHQGFMPRDIDQAWRYATALSKSTFVPQQYQGNPGDCLIAIDISMRLGVHPLAFLQNSYVVHGRPGMESKLVITLINKSALFTDPLDYEVVGDDPFDKDYRVRAYATRNSTGKVLYGPWITWKTVKGEGWDKKPGSKWVTIPEMMFHYRAASWFANKHCPEIKMGLDTVDELADIGPRREVAATVIEDPKISGNEGLKRQLAARNGTDNATTEQSESAVGVDSSEQDGDDSRATEDDAEPAEPTPPDSDPPAVPGLYTCMNCGWTGDETGAKGQCPACKAVSDAVAATSELDGLA